MNEFHPIPLEENERRRLGRDCLASRIVALLQSGFCIEEIREMIEVEDETAS